MYLIRILYHNMVTSTVNSNSTCHSESPWWQHRLSKCGIISWYFGKLCVL